MPTAIIVDLDETILDNAFHEARLASEGRDYDEAACQAWMQEVSAPLLLPAARSGSASRERLRLALPARISPRGPARASFVKCVANDPYDAYIDVVALGRGLSRQWARGFFKRVSYTLEDSQQYKQSDHYPVAIELELRRADQFLTASTPSPSGRASKPARRRRWMTSFGRSRPLLSLLGVPV